MEKTEQSFNTIQQQDCVAAMMGLAAGSIDLVFADPPFNIGYEYDVYQDKLETEHYLEWSREWIAAAHYALKPTGGFWLSIGDEYAAELKLISQEIGFHCRSWVIWYYTFGVNCKLKFTRSHAHLFHFVKDPEQFTFRADALENRIPSARQLVYNDKRANPKGRLPDDTWIIPPAEMAGELQMSESVERTLLTPPEDDQQTWTLRPQDVESCFTASEDTWYIPRIAGTFKERAGFHGCQMPEQLLGRVIRSCSEPGEMVLDPFSGSATTLAVAKKLGRKYLGYDISEEYIEHGQKRLESIHVGDRLDGSPEPLMSAPKTGAKGAAKKTTAKGKSKKKGTTSWNNPEEKQRYYDEVQLELTCQGTQEAFRLSHQGFSVDRIVADPELNSQFIEACKKLGLVGDTFTWNALLFRLRKSGKLSQIETTKQTSLSWDHCDPFLAASEIALQTLLNRKEAISLDEIFCEPNLSSKFDELAKDLAPGFSSFEYRWAALKIRKQAKTARGQGGVLFNARGSQLERLLGKKIPIEQLEADFPNDMQEAPGVYLLIDDSEKVLFAGEASNLRQRLLAQTQPSQFWQAATSKLSLRYRAVDTESLGRLAWQSCLAKKYNPILNYHELRP